ncbi:MAG: PilZ domain-containing protein [Magnetococcales bacterium]|nr:PilZ domain-containing protein [Magnetococcales bacterium]MBF0321713.1 PilZ domain-containing protein [Magnetococcales bacterium]
MSASEPQGSKAHPYDEVIKETQRIETLLSHCLLQQEKVELQVGEQVRIYFTRMASPPATTEVVSTGHETSDHLPSPISQADPILQPEDLKKSIFLEPVEPPIGNVQIRKHPDIPVTMRFFNRMQTIEGKIRFLGTCQNNTDSLLRFTRPEEFGSFRQRRHYRVRVIPTHPAILALHMPDKKTITAKLWDVSVGGIACLLPGPVETLPAGTKLMVSLEIPHVATLSLAGYIRNHEPAPRQPNIPSSTQTIKVGIQLDQPDRVQEDRLNIMVSHIQQAFLASLRQEKDRQPENVAGNRQPSELTKLMALKKKKSLRG